MPEIVNTTEILQAYGPALSAGAILLSAAVASAIALYSIEEQRKIARKRTTLDALSQKEWDRDYIDSKHTFNKLRDHDDGLIKWAQIENRSSDETKIIRSTLNDYELIAVGIKEKVLDEELYKRWFRASFIKDWQQSKAFIMELRRSENMPKAFCEFEWLAEKWSGK